MPHHFQCKTITESGWILKCLSNVRVSLSPLCWKGVGTMPRSLSCLPVSSSGKPFHECLYQPLLPVHDSICQESMKYLFQSNPRASLKPGQTWLISTTSLHVLILKLSLSLFYDYDYFGFCRKHLLALKCKYQNIIPFKTRKNERTLENSKQFKLQY